MRTRFLVLLLIVEFLFIAWSPVYAEPQCHARPQSIQPINKADAEKLWKEIVASYQNKFPGDLYSVVDDSLINMYIADINNDGQLEYIFTLMSHGSAAYTDLAIFRKEKDKFIYLYDIPKPAGYGDGPWYFYDNGQEFLPRLCEKTYVSFYVANNGYRDRETYIWENGATKKACSNAWLNYERQIFLKNYQAKNYDKAFEQLDFAMEDCKVADNNLYMQLKNDLALASFKLGDAKKCLAILSEVKHLDNFKQASLKIKKAIDETDVLCQQVAAQLITLDKPWGSKEYIEILNGDATEKYNRTLEKLIVQTSPNRAAKVLFVEYEAPELLSSLMRDYLNFGEANYVDENRYVSIRGCIPHDCGNKALLWVDTKVGVSLMGFRIAEDTIYLTSRNFTPATVPVAAKKAILVWRSELSKQDKDWIPPLKKVVFFDMQQDKSIDLSPTWLTHNN